MRFWVSWLLLLLLAACGGGDDTWTRCIDSKGGEAGTATAPGLEVELGTVDPVIPVAAQDQTLLVYELSILNSSDGQVELIRVGATSGETIGESPYAGARTLEMPIEGAVITLP